MIKLNWSDVDEIGYQLHEHSPDLDPLTLRFTDLHRRVLELESFAGEPDKSSEKALEAIQMAWWEYYREEAR